MVRSETLAGDTMWSRRRGRGVRQRPAKPCTAVRIRSSPCASGRGRRGPRAGARGLREWDSRRAGVRQFSRRVSARRAAVGPPSRLRLRAGGVVSDSDREDPPGAMVGECASAHPQRAVVGLPGIVREPVADTDRVQRGRLSLAGRCDGDLSIANKRFRSFVAESGGGRLRFPTIGEESSASRFRLGGSRYYGVTWRFRNVLAGCVSGRWFSRSPVGGSPNGRATRTSGASRECSGTAGRLGRRWQAREDPWARPCSEPGLRG